MEINEHIVSFGLLKGGVQVPIGFPVEPNESLFVSISNRKGQVAELEFENVKFEGFPLPGQTANVDMVYILKPLIPAVIEGRKK
jgi:hypothetical protein